MIELSFNKAQLDKVKRLGQSLKALPRRFVVNAAAVAEREVKLCLSGKVLHVRTNRLRSSVGSTVSGDGLEAEIGSGAGRVSGRVPYANIHVTGGVINRMSKKGKRYTIRIPRRDYLTPAGETTVSKFKTILDASLRDVTT